MLPIDRKNEIYYKFLKKKILTIKELADGFNVSEQTIRRDFKELEEAGIITMSYGGAKLHEKSLPTINVEFSIRQKLTLKEKEDIAQLVYDDFDEGDSIFLDNSSTIFTMINSIRDIPMTVVTNAVLVAYKLLNYSNINTILLGGMIDKRNKCTNDDACFKMLEKYRFNKAFISCSSISQEMGITDSNTSIALMRKKIIERANKVYLLVDHTKFDKTSLVQIDNLEGIDYLVTNLKPSDSWVKFLKEKEIILKYPKEGS